MRDTARQWLQRLEGWVFYRLRRRSKQRRLDLFFAVMQPVAGDRVLDVGAGGDSFWREFAAGHRAVVDSLQFVALDIRPLGKLGHYRWQVVADGRQLPFRDGAVAIVFSNSVIEHVGDHDQQQRMAAEIRRVGRRYFVQVPARCFPIEAHYFIPFLSYLPVRWQTKITRGLFGVADPIYLPTERQVRALFPGATVVRERLGGVTKSFLVYGGAAPCRK